MAETRDCPYCAETIDAGVDRCPLCRSILVKGNAPRVSRRLELARVVSIILSVVGVIFPYVASALAEGPSNEAFYLVGPAITIVGLGLFARLKGRSFFWGLFGLLSCIGLLIVAVIDKKCFACSVAVGQKWDECPSCGAPV